MLFALQPIILIHSANGMTEALLVVCLLAATRQLLRWAAGPGDAADGTQLVVAGLLLGLGYLARFEAIVAAAAATVMVMAVSAVRTPRGARRSATVLGDGLLVGLPAAVAFAVWAIVNWAVVGSPFEQFTSIYGNAALVAGARSTGGLAAVGEQLVWLVPLAAPLLVVVVVRAVRRHDPAAAVPLVVFGSVLAFEWALNLSGSLFGFLRYQIMIVPLTAVLLGFLLSRQTGQRKPGGAILGVVAAVLSTALASSAVLVLNRPDLAGQEFLRVRPVADAIAGTPGADTGANGMWAQDRELAAWLDGPAPAPGHGAGRHRIGVRGHRRERQPPPVPHHLRRRLRRGPRRPARAPHPLPAAQRARRCRHRPEHLGRPRHPTGPDLGPPGRRLPGGEPVVLWLDGLGHHRSVLTTRVTSHPCVHFGWAGGAGGAVAARTAPPARPSNASAPAASVPASSITVATLARPPAAVSASAAVSRSTSAAAATMRSARSTSFALVGRMSIIRLR